jgi:hypothetical protein
VETLRVSHISTPPTTTDKGQKRRLTFHLVQKIGQGHFGTFDRMDYEFYFRLGTVTVCFQHRYDCLRAALVELEVEGAKEFWMKGEVTVPIA